MIRKFDIIAFMAGLCTMLFYPTPLGRVAIFELVSYMFAVIILLRGGFRNFDYIQKRLILFGFLWLFSSIFTDMIRKEPLSLSIKANLIILSAPCVLIVAFTLLKRKDLSFLWFIVGYGISGVLSFYILHNGAYLFYAHGAPEFTFYDITRYLSPKQVIPYYADGITYSILFPVSVLWGIPMIILSILFSYGAVEMITNGARNNYLTYSLTALISFIFLFSQRFYKKIIKNSLLALFIALPILYFIFEIYSYTAEEGMLGEFEKNKYEEQVMSSQYGAIGGREASIETAIYALTHPIIGTGNSAVNQDIPQTRVSGHSIIFGAWAFNGIGGLIFWAYAGLILLSFGKKFYLLNKRWILFIMFIIFQAFWNILFSPFGGNRGFLCVVIAYSAIELTKLKTKNNKKVLNTLKNEKVIIPASN